MGKQASVVRLGASLAVYLLMAACGAATSPANDAAQEAGPPAESEQAGPSATIDRLQGAVEAGTGSDSGPAVAGESLDPGEEIRTGAGEAAALHLSDGTLLILNENTVLHLDELAGTPEAPTAHFSLLAGEVFAVQPPDLPTRGVLGVAWPGEEGEAARRPTVRPNEWLVFGRGSGASGFSLAYDSATGHLTATCLAGECGVAHEEEQTDMAGGDVLEVRTAPAPNIPPLPGMNPGSFPEGARREVGQTDESGGNALEVRKLPGQVKYPNIVLRKWSRDNGSVWVSALAFAEITHGSGPGPIPYPVLEPYLESDPASFPFTLDGRSLTVVKVTGDGVEGGAEDIRQLVGGETLHEGEAIHTGPGSGVVLRFDDGSLLALSEDALLHLQFMGGTAEVPVTRLGLDGGELFFTHEGEVPPDAVYEFILPGGDLAKGITSGKVISKGEAVNISVNPESGDFVMTLLQGTAQVVAGEQTFDLTEGSHLEMKGDFTRGTWTPKGSTPTQAMTAGDFGAWLGALLFAGVDPEPFPLMGPHLDGDPSPFPVIVPHLESASNPTVLEVTGLDEPLPEHTPEPSGGEAHDGGGGEEPHGGGEEHPPEEHHGG